MQVIKTTDPGCPSKTLNLAGYLLHDFQTKMAHIQLLYTYEFGEVLIMNNEIQSAAVDQGFYHAKLVSGAIRGSEKNVVIFGGGEGCTARQVLDVAAQATVVQYDYDVEAMMWASFALKHWNKDVYNDSRLKVVIADANKVELESSSADAVIIDLFDYRPEEEDFMMRVICKGASALRPGGRLSAYLGDDTAELRLFIDRLQLGDKFVVHKSLALIPSYGGANSVFLMLERVK